MHNWLATFFLFCYWKFKPPHCLWLRHLCRIYATYIFLIESTGSVRRCFRSEHESDNPIPRVLSRVCMSEGTNQAPFSINELCRFHIRQWVGVGMVEPISVTTKWVSEWHICISKPITKAVWVSMCSKIDLQWRYITTFIAAVQHLSCLNIFWQFWLHLQKMFKVKSLCMPS